jgi:hypothetical protein
MSNQRLQPIFILSVAMLLLFSNIYSFSKFLSLFAGYFRTRFTCFSPHEDIPESALSLSRSIPESSYPFLQTSPSNRNNPHKRIIHRLKRIDTPILILLRIQPLTKRPHSHFEKQVLSKLPDRPNILTFTKHHTP